MPVHAYHSQARTTFRPYLFPQTPDFHIPLSRLSFLRVAGAAALASLLVGCVAVPGDPYYDSGSAGGYYAGSSVTVYEQPGVIYTAPPAGWRNYPPPPMGWR